MISVLLLKDIENFAITVPTDKVWYGLHWAHAP